MAVSQHNDFLTGYKPAHHHSHHHPGVEFRYLEKARVTAPYADLVLIRRTLQRSTVGHPQRQANKLHDVSSTCSPSGDGTDQLSNPLRLQPPTPQYDRAWISNSNPTAHSRSIDRTPKHSLEECPDSPQGIKTQTTPPIKATKPPVSPPQTSNSSPPLTFPNPPNVTPASAPPPPPHPHAPPPPQKLRRIRTSSPPSERTSLEKVSIHFTPASKPPARHHHQPPPPPPPSGQSDASHPYRPPTASCNPEKPTPVQRSLLLYTPQSAHAHHDSNDRGRRAFWPAETAEGIGFSPARVEGVIGYIRACVKFSGRAGPRGERGPTLLTHATFVSERRGWEVGGREGGWMHRSCIRSVT